MHQSIPTGAPKKQHWLLLLLLLLLHSGKCSLTQLGPQIQLNTHTQTLSHKHTHTHTHRQTLSHTHTNRLSLTNTHAHCLPGRLYLEPLKDLWVEQREHHHLLQRWDVSAQTADALETHLGDKRCDAEIVYSEYNDRTGVHSSGAFSGATRRRFIFSDYQSKKVLFAYNQMHIHLNVIIHFKHGEVLLKSFTFPSLHPSCSSPSCRWAWGPRRRGWLRSSSGPCGRPAGRPSGGSSADICRENMESINTHTHVSGLTLSTKKQVYGDLKWSPMMPWNLTYTFICWVDDIIMYLNQI